MTTPSTAYGTSPLNFNGVAAPINFRHKRADIVLQNGANDNIARNDANYLRITGPSAAFSISGFDTPLSGMMLYVQVAIAQQLTIKNKASSPVKNQIDTLTYADVVITSTPCVITFIYDASAQKWVYGGLQANVPSPVTVSASPKLVYHGVTAIGQGQSDAQSDLLFVGSTTNVYMAHIGQPANPKFAGLCYATLNTDTVKNIVVAGKYLYMLTSGASKYLKILDVSNPYAATLVSSTVIANLLFNDLSIITSGASTYVVLATSNPDCQIWNVTTPATPALATTITSTGPTRAKGCRYGVYVIDNTAKTLRIYTAVGATLRGTYTFAGGIDPWHFTVMAGKQNRTGSKDPESIVYVADRATSNILVINCLDTTAPSLATTFLADSTLGLYNAGTTAWIVDSLEIGGGYLFVGGDWFDSGTNAGLIVQHNLLNPLLPVQISRNYDAFNVTDYPAFMKCYNNHVYCISGGTTGVFVYAYT